MNIRTVKRGEEKDLLNREDIIVFDLDEGKFAVPYNLRSAWSWRIGATKYDEHALKKQIFVKWKSLADSVDLKSLISEKEIVIMYVDDKSFFVEAFEKFLRWYLGDNDESGRGTNS